MIIFELIEHRELLYDSHIRIRFQYVPEKYIDALFFFCDFELYTYSESANCSQSNEVYNSTS